METWITVGTVLGGASALVAAVAAIFAAIFTYRIMQAGQTQTDLSQKQFQQSVEAQCDTQLPVLVPTESLISVGEMIPDNRGGYTQPEKLGHDRTQPWVRVSIENVGPGIALNIWGVVFEPEPQQEVLRERGQHHMYRYAIPLAPGEMSKVDWPGGAAHLSGDTEIGTTTRHKLYGPPIPHSVETVRGVTEKIARLTLTYSDIFGRKHAAIYDLTAQMQWENVDYLRAITEDLGDLERKARSHLLMYRAPEIPTSPSQ